LLENLNAAHKMHICSDKYFMHFNRQIFNVINTSPKIFGTVLHAREVIWA